jgi:hypothetical protein
LLAEIDGRSRGLPPIEGRLLSEALPATAFAADLPVKAPSVVAPVVYSWTGSTSAATSVVHGGAVTIGRMPGLASVLGTATTMVGSSLAVRSDATISSANL